MIKNKLNMDKESVIYKSNAQKGNISCQKTGNKELDKGLKENRFNSMPNFVHSIIGGLAQ